jgi:hypothetical protein
MALDKNTQIVITAKDETAAGFASVAAGVGRLGGQFSGLANPVALATTAVAAASAAMVASIKSAVDTGDQLNKLSQKTGIAVESLSALAYAGDLSDVSIESLATGIKKLSVNMSEAAASTSGKAAEAFKALGVSVKDASGNLRDSDAVMADIADRFAGMKDGAGKTALAVALFGKAGADLIPLLNQGSRGLAEMRVEAEKLGLVMTGKMAKDAEEFNDNIKKLSLSTSALGRSIAADLLGPLAEYTRLVVQARVEGAGLFTALAVGLRTGGADGKTLDELRERAASLQGTISNLSSGGVTNDNTPVFSAKLRAAKAELSILQKQIAARMADAGEVIPPYAPGEKANAPAISDGDDSAAKRAAKKAAADLQRMIEVGERNLASTIDSEEEQRLLAASRGMQDVRKEYEALQRILKTGEQNELAAYYETAGEETMRLVAEQRALKDAGTGTFADLTRAVEGWGNAFTDTMADMVLTGKANFSDLANSIIRDLTRIQIKKNLTDPIVKAGTSFLDDLFKGFGSSGSSSTPAFDASLPYYAQGTNYVPNDGPAFLHKGEAVIPAAQNNGGGGGLVLNTTINAPGADSSVIPQINAALAALEQRIYRNVPGITARQQLRNRITPMAA